MSAALTEQSQKQDELKLQLSRIALLMGAFGPVIWCSTGIPSGGPRLEGSLPKTGADGGGGSEGGEGEVFGF